MVPSSLATVARCDVLVLVLVLLLVLGLVLALLLLLDLLLVLRCCWCAGVLLVLCTAAG